MTESDARDVVLVRAWESAPSAAWSKSDADWASREAARLEGERASPERLIARRATLAAARLSEREPAVRRALATSRAPRWIGWVLVSVAFVIGLASDAIGPARRVDLLAPALLALLVWNLAVYLLLALSALRTKGEAPFGPVRRALSGALVRSARHAPGAVGRFVVDWRDASRALDAARIASVLHASAAAIAAGALAAMYLRGLAFEYRAGWDSTFLTPAAVHQLLSFVLGPASALSGIALPDVQHLASLRWSVGNGENAARWIHLHALTVAIVVLLPRGVLALRSAWRTRRLVREFPLPIDDAYFRALLREQRSESLPVHVIPYSYRPPPEALDGLRAVLERSLGARLQLHVAPPAALGSEDDAAAVLSSMPAAATPPVTVCLFALTATPEREHHGAFVRALAARHPMVLIDESGFRRRIADASRIEQRRDAWRRMLRDEGVEPTFFDLASPEAASAADLSLHTPAAT